MLAAVLSRRSSLRAATIVPRRIAGVRRLVDSQREGLLNGGRGRLTIGLVLITTLTAFEALAVATAMPAVEDDLGGVELYGLAFSAFMLSSLIGITSAGQQSDTAAPAKPFAAGVALLGLGLVVAGVAPSMGVLVVGRTIQGLGSGAVSTVTYVAIGRGYSERLQPRMFALLAAAWVVPGLVGPAAAGVIAEHLGWRVVFLGLLPLLPLVAVLTFPVLRTLQPRSVVSTPSRTLAAVLLACGAGALLFGLASPLLVAAPLVVAGAGASIVSLRRLLPPGTFLARAGLPAVVATAGLTNVAFGGAEAFLPFALTEVRGLTPSRAGLALTAAVLSWTAGTQIQSRRAHRWPPRLVTAGGLVFVTVGIGSTLAVLAEGVPVYVGVLTWAVSGFGMGLAIPTIALATLAEAADDALGSASAAMNLATVLGLAMGTGLGGAVLAIGDSAEWAPTTSIATVFAMMVALGTVAFCAALRMPGAAAPVLAAAAADPAPPARVSSTHG